MCGEGTGREMADETALAVGSGAICSTFCVSTCKGIAGG